MREVVFGSAEVIVTGIKRYELFDGVVLVIGSDSPEIIQFLFCSELEEDIFNNRIGKVLLKGVVIKVIGLRINDLVK